MHQTALAVNLKDRPQLMCLLNMQTAVHKLYT